MTTTGTQASAHTRQPLRMIGRQAVRLCSCGESWPCPIATGEAEIERLRAELAQQLQATRDVDDLRMAEIGELRRLLSERDALVIAALDEAAADRDERARDARQKGRTEEECGHLEVASQYRAERDRLEAGQ